MRRRWIDVSVPIRPGMVRWPGNPPVEVRRVRSIARGASSNLTRLSLGAHTGTHMDAPAHFLAGGAGIEALPLEAVIGPCRVVAIGAGCAIGPDDLRRHRPRRGERLLLKTRNSARRRPARRFVPDFVHLSAPAARYLAARGVRTVGVDYLSVGGYRRDGAETHRVLLGAGVWIIEGLDLSRVRPGRYDLVCLPLRVPGADGAPARAVLRRR